MNKLAVFLVLLGLFAMVACGGDRLSLDEYAEECGDLADELNDGFDLGANPSSSVTDIFEDFEEAINDFTTLNPPEDLERLHELYVEASETALSAIQDSDLVKFVEELQELEDDIEDLDYDDQMDRMEDFQDDWEDRLDEMEESFEDIEDQMEDFEEDIEEELDDLHPDDYEILSDEGCLSIFQF